LVDHPNVLIVDQKSESREVLRAVLESRGMQVLEAVATDEGLELLGDRRPDLVVLDLDAEPAHAKAAASRFAAQSEANQIPLVVIGAARRHLPALAQRQFIAKPYHYASLIRKIETLLEAARAPLTECEA
jgi:DNA-binding response OmpR family regulator